MTARRWRQCRAAATCVVLAAVACTGCQPRLGQFEVTSSTEETLVLWDETLRAGTGQP